MKFGLVSVVVFGLGAIAGCGAGAVIVHSHEAHRTTQPTLQPVALQVPGHCAIDFRTLATASEAYWAMNMAYPQDQSQLVNAGLLREVIDDFELTIVGNLSAVVGVQDCAAFEPDESSFDPEPESTSVPSTCESDLRALETAWEAYTADTGNPPTSEADLVNAGLLRQESAGFDLVGTEFVPVPGVCA